MPRDIIYDTKKHEILFPYIQLTGPFIKILNLKISFLKTALEGSLLRQFEI